ncbi:tetratricopeptide repeat protein [Kingella oralis]|uniref:tetratricopeptide repeat protein n=1 Tax=Kingella oralis TaxID=505 RepID=UPI0034E4599A
MMVDLCRFFKPLNGALAALLLACAMPAWADNKVQLQQGVTAYKAGNYNKALRLLQPLAQQGDAYAQHNLGIMHYQGKGIAQDYQQARAWWQKAANQGYAAAQYNLGMMYIKGRGVAQNYQQAFAWCQKAANQGFADAQNNLGVMYANGKGVAKDYQQAKAWWQKVLAQPDTADNAEAKVAARAGLQQLRNMGIR